MSDPAKFEIVEASAREVPALVQQNSVVERIAMLAIDPAVSVEKMTALIDMRDRLEASAARKAFDLAISLAKSEIPPIIKDAHVGYDSRDTDKPRTDYDHETLAQIAKTVDPILGKYGLSYRYRTEQTQGGVVVHCVLSHRDGHSETTTLASPIDTSGKKNPIQAIGSAVTYLQRYTIKAALGLAAAKRDDDGRTAGSGPTINADQFRQLSAALSEAGIPASDLTKFYGVEHLEELPGPNFGAAMALVRQRTKGKHHGN